MKNDEKESPRQNQSLDKAGGATPPVADRAEEHDEPMEDEISDASLKQELKAVLEKHGIAVDAKGLELRSELKTLTVKTSTRYSGPIPPADQLAEYENVLDGAAERIFRMAELQGEHRRSLEAKSVEAQIADMSADRDERRRGQAYGFWVAVVIIVAGILGTVFAPNATGQIGSAIFGAGGVATIVSLFVIGSRGKHTDTVPTPPEVEESNQDSPANPTA